MSSNKLAVIIVTKDRPRDLARCLTALKQNSLRNFQLIIVDQSQEKPSAEAKKQLLKGLSKVSYLHSQASGKSKGLNQALQHCRAEIVAFTDDDCLPAKNWLQEILKSFAQHKNITAVFGRVLPYQPAQHSHLICPLTFDRPTAAYIKQPREHWRYIGFGCNMAWKRSFFLQYGNFKEWLGPGSVGANAEDAEISLRALQQRQLLFYNPKVLLRHNKWLTSADYHRQQLIYLKGEIACYGYLAAHGSPLGRKIVGQNLHNNLREGKAALIACLKLQKQAPQMLHNLMSKIKVELAALGLVIFRLAYEKVR